MAEAAPEPRRSGWYRSPGGVLAHADGPSQVRAFAGLGYTEVDEAEAVAEVGDGLRLTVDDPTGGTFDADAVQQAVADESTGRRRADRKRAGSDGGSPSGG